MNATRDMLALRSRVLQAIRGFFAGQDFIEVETPVRVPTPALEPHIDAEPCGDAFLRTSPELHLKRAIAGGCPRIFELGPCFRRGEHGRRHRSEFTMLEWYRADAGYLDVLADTRGLIAHVARTVLGGTRCTYAGHPIELLSFWEVLSVREAYLLHAGWDPFTGYDNDRFDLDMVDLVEPALAREHPVVLKDYPAENAALARIRRDVSPPVAERWELYIGGLELANAYSELVDAGEQRARFDACAAERRAAGRTTYAMDEAFLAALANGMPPCAGVALGVDRLVMLLGDATDIAAVRAF